MEWLDRLINKWEKRLETYTADKREELALCLSELKMAEAGDFGKFPPASLDGTCHFKKHKGKKWKEVIESDPGYVDFCLDKVSGFELDEYAFSYLIEIQNK